MAHILEQLFGAFATLGLVLLAGYAPARLLLPSDLQRWFWLAVPLLGYATSAISLGWISIFLPLSLGVWLFLGATIVVSALVLLRDGLPSGRQAWLEQAVVGTLAAIALSIGLLPLWDRPELLAIGPNWDIEIYLPLAEYLKQFSTGFSLTDPAGLPFPGGSNPLLWRINFFDPRWAGLAFSQLHSAVGVILHQEAHQHFAGVLALLGALSLPAAFLFFRAAFGLDRTSGLLATTLLAFNPATLYVVFWSFGQQVASLPLAPLALLAGLLALRRPGVPVALLAGLSLAALLATFIPAGLLYGLPFAALVLHAGLSVHQRREVFSTTLGIVGTSLVLAPWAYLRGALRAYHFLEEGGAIGLTVGPDVTRFPPLTWALGLAATPESPVAGPLSSLFSLLLPVLVVAALIVAFRRKNAPLLACSLAFLALLGILRFMMPYPYGYLKLLPSGSFIMIGLLV
ncbi:MAG TPA: hypothetical protein VJA25_11330, partial [Dehalococcoidia bacterium]|nr:hypothetical protein [Dehalococcoidia bacterium]